MLKKSQAGIIMGVFVWGGSAINPFTVQPCRSLGSAKQHKVYYLVTPGDSEILLPDTFMVTCNNSYQLVTSVKFKSVLPQGMVPVIRKKKTYIDQRVEMVVEFFNESGASSDTPQAVVISCLAVDKQEIQTRSVTI